MAHTKHSEESEKSIEEYLRSRSKQLGWIPLKYHNAVSTGFPDRIVLMPDCRCFWVELKSKGKNPTKLQSHRITCMRELGQRVYICDSRDSVDMAIAAEIKLLARQPS